MVNMRAFFLYGIVLSIFLILPISSAFLLTASPSYSINRTISTLFNFTINNTEAGNISEIRILFPMETTFYAGSNATSAVANFTNNTVGPNIQLLWNTTVSSGIVPNESRLQSFYFNAAFRRVSGGAFFTQFNISSKNLSGYTNSTTMTYVVNFAFAGYVRNETGGNESNVNVTMYQFGVGNNGPPTETWEANVLSDSNGYFIFPSLNGSSSMYELKMIRYGTDGGCVSLNSSCNATRVSSVLPSFPPEMFYPATVDNPAFEFMIPPSLNGTNFYLNPATTLRLWAHNNSKLQKFGYEVVDQVVGFPIGSNVMASVNTTDIIVPLGRNYTVMFARFPSFGGGSGFSFSPACNGAFMNDSNCPSPPISNSSLGTLVQGQILIVNQSMVTTNERLTGCINLSVGSGLVINGTSSTINITGVIPKMLPWSGFVPPIRADRGDINITRDINYTNPACNGMLAFYNLSVMGSTSGITYLLEFYAKNASNEAGGGTIAYASFQNISSVSYANSTINVTLFKLFGAYNATTGNAVNTSYMKINIQNATGGVVTNNMNANIKIKNPTTGTLTYIIESMASGTFYVPILNNSNWAKIMVFANDAPPKEITLNLSVSENNITLVTMSDGRGVGFKRVNSSGGLEMINSTQLNGTTPMTMRFLRNSVDCNGVVPGAGCVITSMNAKSFNPLKALVAGKINMEVKITSTNVTMMFYNYDMFSAKQPPMDSVLNENASAANSSQQTWQFGSFAPASAYDYAIVAMPYSNSSGSSNFFNDDADSINVTIPTLYDENWNAVWNLSRGDTSANLSDDFIDYNSSSLYRTFLSGAGASCSLTDSNLNVTPCYINKTAQTMYMRVPHFSGIAPTTNALSAAVSSSSTSTSSSGGGSLETSSFWTSTFGYDAKDFSVQEPLAKELSSGNRIKIGLGGETHYVGVVAVGGNTATINISSTPQQATFTVGESKKFEISGDTFYDLLVTLNGIMNNKANLTIAYIHEAMPPPASQTGENEKTPTTNNAQNIKAPGGALEKKIVRNAWLWALVVIVVIGIVVFAIFRLKKNLKMRGLNGMKRSH